MKTFHWVWMMALATALVAGMAAPRNAAADQKLFEGKKCTQCHSIQAVKIEKVAKKDGSKRKGPDLSGVGLHKITDAELIDFLNKKSDKKSVYKDAMVKHKKKFKGSDAELKKLVAYLQTMKSDIKVADDGAADDADDEE